MRQALLSVACGAVLLPGLAAPAGAGEGRGKGAGGLDLSGVDEARVDAAIRKGVEYLKTAGSPNGTTNESTPVANSDELILLTLIDAGTPPGDPKLQALLKSVLEAPLERTYKVSLQAMALEALDSPAHFERLYQCAQFLVDNQCKNGQWSYGEPTTYPPVKMPVQTPSPPPPTLSGPGGGEAPPPASADAAASSRQTAVRRAGPARKTLIEVKKQKSGPDQGDNSNSQYAALGLRACHQAGIGLPKETITLAREWWEKSQHGGEKEGKKRVSTGPGAIAEPRGWCYGAKDSHAAYSSMTAGAVGCLAIYDHLLGQDWKRDVVLAGGMAWLAKNFSVTENVGPPETGGRGLKAYYYYNLYAIERLGMLLGVDRIGSHKWYQEGAKVILDAQAADGSWNASVYKAMQKPEPVWDTCFAILFLKRGTRPLVYSPDSRGGGK